MVKKGRQTARKRNYPPKVKKGEAAPSPIPAPPSFGRQLVGLIVLALRDVFHWPRSGRSLPKTTSLHEAARRGDLAEIQRLLKEGTNPNVQDDELNTPLHCAASYGATSLLLKAGADPNALNAHHLAPLNLAKGKQAQLLFRHGARPAPPPPILNTAGLS